MHSITITSISASLLFTLLFVYQPNAAVAEDFRPNLGPDMPAITVTCEDVTILLRQKSQWTPGRIDFCGAPMTTESSAYGTVFRFPKIGFIGTAHLENEPEDLQSLSFFLNGEKLEAPSAEIDGQTFRFVRESRIRGLRLRNVVEIRENCLYEAATITAEDDVPLELVYHFMHAWLPSMSALLAGNDSEPGELIHQPLRDDESVNRKFYLNRPVDWVAVFEPHSRQFAVSRLLESPQATGSSSKVWNCAMIYRKYYLTSFQNETVPKGFSGTWRMVTAFGKGNSDTWQAAAVNLAQELSE